MTLTLGAEATDVKQRDQAERVNTKQVVARPTLLGLGSIPYPSLGEEQTFPRFIVQM
jgi:hypothetical protein